MRRAPLFLLLFIVPALVSCATGPKKLSLVRVAQQEQLLRDEVSRVTDKTDVEVIGGVEYKRYYTVKGDNLWKISKKFYGNGKFWQLLTGPNNLSAPYKLREGKKLLMPITIPADKKAAAAGNKAFEYRYVTNTAFGVGEKLVFAVKYFNVTAGFGTLEIKELAEVHGRQCYHIEATAITSPFFETFYRVRDKIESWMDVKAMCSQKYSKTLEEGSYRAFSAIEFFHDKAKALKHTNEEYDTVSFVNDVLSELYYYRTFDLSKGVNDEVWIDVCADEGKTYQVLIKKLAYEKVSVDAGEFDCIKIQPFLKYEGIFRQQGDVYIWITNDENRIPVKVESKIVIGSVDAVLQEAIAVKPE